MKKLILILGVALLTTSVLLSCSGNDGIETKDVVSPTYSKPKTVSKRCKVCYKSYTGSGYVA
ncbi:MAG: hypothetical protein P8H56_01355, partial [Crocinitomicaceae bacterium]|nr:hypothetical protein [Crocinitomicaceae bacterium]